MNHVQRVIIFHFCILCLFVCITGYKQMRDESKPISGKPTTLGSEKEQSLPKTQEREIKPNNLQTPEKHVFV